MGYLCDVAANELFSDIVSQFKHQSCDYVYFQTLE